MYVKPNHFAVYQINYTSIVKKKKKRQDTVVGSIKNKNAINIIQKGNLSSFVNSGIFGVSTLYLWIHPLPIPCGYELLHLHGLH